jgi:hypothetical protein
MEGQYKYIGFSPHTLALEPLAPEDYLRISIYYQRYRYRKNAYLRDKTTQDPQLEFLVLILLFDLSRSKLIQAFAFFPFTSKEDRKAAPNARELLFFIKLRLVYIF